MISMAYIGYASCDCESLRTFSRVGQPYIDKCKIKLPLQQVWMIEIALQKVVEHPGGHH